MGHYARLQPIVSFIVAACVSGAVLMACGVVAGIEEFNFVPNVVEGGLVADGPAPPPPDVITNGDGAACDTCDASAPVVFSPATKPDSIAVVGGYVVWTELDGAGGGSLHGCPRAGCTAPTLLGTDKGSLTAPMLRQAGNKAGVTTLYQKGIALSAGAVAEVKGDGTLAPLVVDPATVDGPVAAAALTATHALVALRGGISYYIARDGSGQSAGGFANGLGGESTLVDLSGTHAIYALTTGVAFCDFAVGCADTWIPRGKGAASDMYIDDQLLFVAAAPELDSYPIAGGAEPTIVAASATAANVRITVDDTDVYIANPASNLTALAKATGTARVVVPTGAIAVAVDGQYIYWVEPTRIMRMPK